METRADKKINDKTEVIATQTAHAVLLSSDEYNAKYGVKETHQTPAGKAPWGADGGPRHIHNRTRASKRRRRKRKTQTSAPGRAPNGVSLKLYFV